MKAAGEFQRFGDVFFWEAYEPAVKTDLSCCAVRAAAGLVFIDPIPLAEPALAELLLEADAAPAAIVLTNANHLRAATSFQSRWQIPLLAHADAIPELGAAPDRLLHTGEIVAGSLAVIEIDGAAPGEIGLYAPGKSLHLGDAVIHVPPYGFAPLPKKYALDYPQLLASLRILSELDFCLLTFAHGTPLSAHSGTTPPELLRRMIASA